MPEGAQSVLTRISRAVDRGTIPPLNVNSTPQWVAVVAPDAPQVRNRHRRWVKQPTPPAVIAWFERTFPGGEHRLSAAGPALDRWEYHAPGVGRVGLVVRYSKAHEHHQLTCHVALQDGGRGVAGAGLLRWACPACSTDLTNRQVRALGLSTAVVL